MNRASRQRAERNEIRRLLRKLREALEPGWTPRQRHVALVAGPACDYCEIRGLDVRESVVERNMGDSGTGWAFHDVPVKIGKCCVGCRIEEDAVPEEEF